MRIPVLGLKHVVLVAAVALGLSGCVYAGPGYGYYGQPYYPAYSGPAYYGPPVVGSVWIGGGGRHWR